MFCLMGWMCMVGIAIINEFGWELLYLGFLSYIVGFSMMFILEKEEKKK